MVWQCRMPDYGMLETVWLISINLLCWKLTCCRSNGSMIGATQA